MIFNLAAYWGCAYNAGGPSHGRIVERVRHVQVQSIAFHGRNGGAREGADLNGGARETVGRDYGVGDLMKSISRGFTIVRDTHREVEENISGQNVANEERKECKSSEFETHCPESKW